MENIKDLISKLKDSEWKIRVEAARTLEKLKGPEAVKLLIKLLSDEKWQVRRTAVECLGNLKDPMATPDLINSLSIDEDLRIRLAAAFALAYIGEKTALEPLLSALEKDKNWQVRQASGAALKFLGYREAVPFLIKALEDADWHVRVQAAESLGVLGDLAASEPLSQAAKKADPQARQVMEKALRQIKEANDPKSRGKPGVERIITKEEILRMKRESQCKECNP